MRRHAQINAFAICVALLPVQSAAQDLTVSEAEIRRCMAQAADGDVRPDCIGDAANVCQGLPQGSTTIGIGACLSAETTVWDMMLNEEYTKARKRFAESGGTELSDHLRDAQRAWIAFRDAECAMRYQRYIDGSIRTVVAGACRMNMTAQRAIELRDLSGGY